LPIQEDDDPGNATVTKETIETVNGEASTLPEVKPDGERPAPGAVRVADLSSAYGDDLVLRDVSFAVQRGEIFAILGGSGSGKSTLFKHLVGLRKPNTGRVEILGEDIFAATGSARRQILRGIGVAYQSGALFGSMTLRQNVSLPLEEFTELPADAIKRIADLKLGLVGLERFASHLPSQVSGGMRNHAAVARAMALDPHILFLDEPSAGLDPAAAAEFDCLIARLARDFSTTIVLVTQDLPSVFTVAHRVILLDRAEKTIIAAGDPHDLRDNSDDPRVQRFFHRGART
jgi:phospholipid/cholesterol/gamma-HCH transport system ATP-binding protein